MKKFVFSIIFLVFIGLSVWIVYGEDVEFKNYPAEEWNAVSNPIYIVTEGKNKITKIIIKILVNKEIR